MIHLGYQNKRVWPPYDQKCKNLPLIFRGPWAQCGKVPRNFQEISLIDKLTKKQIFLGADISLLLLVIIQKISRLINILQKSSRMLANNMNKYKGRYLLLKKMFLKSSSVLICLKMFSHTQDSLEFFHLRDLCFSGYTV